MEGHGQSDAGAAGGPSITRVIVGVVGTVLFAAFVLAMFFFGSMVGGFVLDAKAVAALAVVSAYGLLAGSFFVPLAILFAVPSYFLASRRIASMFRSARLVSVLSAALAALPGAASAMVSVWLLAGLVGDFQPNAALAAGGFALGAGWIVGVPIAWCFGGR